MRRRQILVVEDEQDIAELLILLLEREGHWVEHARDGEDAWQMLTKRPWDLILTDLMMPRLDGAELVQKLRGDARLATLPVMMLSAVPENIVRAKCGSLDAFLHKPFAVEQLLLRVRRLLAE